MGLYFSSIVIKGFNKLFQAKIITVKLKDGLLSNPSLRIRPLIFINEAYRLSGSAFVATVVPRQLSFLWQAFTMCCVMWPCPSILSMASII